MVLRICFYFNVDVLVELVAVKYIFTIHDLVALSLDIGPSCFGWYFFNLPVYRKVKYLLVLLFRNAIKTWSTKGKGSLLITHTCPCNILVWKNDNFQFKFYGFFSYFCSKHRLWVHVITPSSEAILASSHNLCFRAKIWKKMYTPLHPTFTI